MLIKFLLIMGTLAIFGRCRLVAYEPNVPDELNLKKED